MKNTKKTLTELMGHEPGRRMILKILEEVRTSGMSLEEVAGRHSLPTIFILDKPDSPLKYRGEEISLEEFKKRYPFKPIVIITSR